MIKLIYFDFNFWRVDILRLCLSHSKTPNINTRELPRKEWFKKKVNFPLVNFQEAMVINGKQFLALTL